MIEGHGEEASSNDDSALQEIADGSRGALATEREEEEERHRKADQL